MLYEITNRLSGEVVFAIETNSLRRAVEHAADMGPGFWAKPVDKTDREPWSRALRSGNLFKIKKPH